MAAADSSTQRLSYTNIPQGYDLIPLQQLAHSTRHELCLHLNIHNDVHGNDWRAVAEMVGCRHIEIENMKQKANPMEGVLLFAMRKDLKLGQFMTILRNIERPDVFRECGKFIERDADSYQPIQVNEVSSQYRPPLTLGELNTGQIEYFDAFVSYHPEDLPFVQELIQRLEEEEGFKLCVSDRNMIVGITENVATAELIEKRCKRVILVLSLHYISSEEEQALLQWQMQFSQALAPVAKKMHKLVPIIVEEGVTAPSILKPYNQCDYTKKSIRQWFWIRLIQSLSAPTNGGGGYEGPVDPPRLGRDIHKDYKAYNGGSSSNQGGHGDKNNRNRSSTAPAELSKTSDVKSYDRSASISGTDSKACNMSMTSGDFSHYAEPESSSGSSQFYIDLAEPSSVNVPAEPLTVNVPATESPKPSKKSWKSRFKR